MLFPKINLPRIEQEQPSLVEHKLSPLFDFETGEFFTDKAGRVLLGDGFENWCIKMCVTERGTRLAYSDKIGVELETLPQEQSFARAKSRIARTITEAISVHPRTQSVKNFSIKAEADEVHASFDVNGKRLEVTL